MISTRPGRRSTILARPLTLHQVSLAPKPTSHLVRCHSCPGTSRLGKISRRCVSRQTYHLQHCPLDLDRDPLPFPHPSSQETL